MGEDDFDLDNQIRADASSSIDSADDDKALLPEMAMLEQVACYPPRPHTERKSSQFQNKF